MERALTLIRQYYPDVVLSRDAENPVRLQQEWNARLQLTRTFSLVVDTETAGSAEIADALMHDLAAEGLISEFYSWGETGAVSSGYLGYSMTDNGEYVCHYSLHENDDSETVKQYLTEHDLNCTVKVETNVYDDSDFVFSSLQVILNGRRTFRELFDVASVLYEEFGYCMWIVDIGMSNNLRYGQNALALTGDVNLDCSVDVSDAVLTARYIAEDSEAVFTECGVGNADTDGDGSVTTDDVALLLQFIAKKIS